MLNWALNRTDCPSSVRDTLVETHCRSLACRRKLIKPGLGPQVGVTAAKTTAAKADFEVRVGLLIQSLVIETLSHALLPRSASTVSKIDISKYFTTTTVEHEKSR